MFFIPLQLIFTPAAAVSSIQSDVSSASSSSQPPPVTTQVSLMEKTPQCEHYLISVWISPPSVFAPLYHHTESCDHIKQMLLSMLQVQNLSVQGAAGDTGALKPAQLPTLAIKPAALSLHHVTKPAGKKGESGTDSQTPPGRTAVSTHAIIAPGDGKPGGAQYRAWT